MKIRTCLTILFLFAAGAARSQSNDELPVANLYLESTGITRLEIKTPQNLKCDMLIESSPADNVQVAYQKWASAKSSEQARRFEDLIDIKADAAVEEDGVMRLRILTPLKAPWEGTDYSAGVELKITAPPNLFIDSRSSFSDVKVKGPFKGIKIDNEYGVVNAEKINGETTVKTSYSEIKLNNLQGAVSVDAIYSQISGKSIKITSGSGFFATSYGAVELKDVSGPIEVSTSYGAISATDIDAGRGSVILRTSYGDIKGENLKGELVCETSYNPIDLENISLTHGMNKIETRYSPIQAAIKTIGDSRLQINNTYNSINLSVDSLASARYMLAVDEGGKIATSGLTIKPLVLEKNRLVGIVGDGLSRVELNIDGIGEINLQGR